MAAVVAPEAVARSEAHQPQKQHVIDPDEGFVDTRSQRQQWLEFTLVCFCNIAWTIDASLLPMFFTEFQALFHVSQTSLSLLSTVKGWTAAIFAFPCGFLGELLPRPRLIGMGMVFWACGLAICGTATSYEMLFVGRTLNGVGLGVVHPLLLSLIADKNPPTKRGMAYGSMFFTGAVCNTVFGLFATQYADAELLGIAGWRISVFAIVILSAAVGILIMMFVEEPNAPFLEARWRTQGLCSVFVKNMPKVVRLFRVPTFVLILAQGAPGTAPWTVFPFFTQWLELSCFTHKETAMIFAAFGWGGALSNLVSGWLTNFVARRCPDRGPPTIANVSVASGLPFLVLFFFLLPKPASLGEGGGQLTAYIISFLLFGLFASMCGTLNKKVFADIVPPEIVTYVFAVDELIVNAIGNLAGVAVGVITDDVFHYDASAVQGGGCAPKEARALGMGMFWVCNVAWLVCFLVYLGMFWTYPRDRKKQLILRREASLAKKAEMTPVADELGGVDDRGEGEDAAER